MRMKSFPARVIDGELFKSVFDIGVTEAVVRMP